MIKAKVNIYLMKLLFVSLKNNCDNKTAEENFKIIIESVMCESSTAICSRKIKIQLGVRPEVKNFNNIVLLYLKYISSFLSYW